MYESKSEAGRKFGSAFRGKRFDSYHGTEQPGGNNENETAEPQEKGASEADVSKAHSPVVHTHVVHDHEGNKHTVTSKREDGTTDMVEHGSAKEAHDSAEKLALESYGEGESATDVKKRSHPDQQGAEGEERGYFTPDLA